MNAELEMKEGTMIVIAIARWVYHKERCTLVHRHNEEETRLRETRRIFGR